MKNTSEWIDTKAKRLFNLGLEHTNRIGKNINAKQMGTSCKCRMKCSEKISEATRKELFGYYWSLGDKSRQWDFVARYVKIFEKKVSTNSSSRRQLSKKYYFPIKNEEIQVCKIMFLKTFSISEKIVTNVGKKLVVSPVIPSDKRGLHNNRPHKISTEVTDGIKQHISKFPVVDSHYTRENSKKQYLESDLSIAKMHRLYLEWAKEHCTISEKAQMVTLRQYTDIFNESFNLSFFKPKKDLCDVCETFKLASSEEKLLLKTSYEEHLKNKSIVRDKKKIDKERAINEPEFCVAVFDLQKVLITPKSEASSFYYKRKFATYNFTVYDIGKKIGYCYTWNECEAKRGSSEIATCLLKFMKHKKENGVKDFCFYSDNCGGQNRNRYVFAMWEYAAFKLKVKITHRFFEKGHTQNEGDSVHACIENAQKGKIIYVPAQWITLISCAKVTGNPYKVFEVSNEEFLNFKPLVDEKQFNWKTADDSTKIKWNSIKEITVSYKDPYQLFIKYDLSAADFIKIDISKIHKKQKGRHQPRCKPIKAYNGKLSIEKLKIADLLSLCSMGLIPTTYHDFYKSLQ